MNKSNSWRKFGWVMGVMFMLLMTFVGHAADDGRYQAFVLQEAGGSGGTVTLMPSVFIIDSRDGHMWTWEKNMPLPGLDGKRGFGTLITYQGQVKPGAKIGEIINHTDK